MTPGSVIAAAHSRTVAVPAEIDRLIDGYLLDAVDSLDGSAPLLAGMARYHFGWTDAELSPIAPGLVDGGKRFRPAVALLACTAAGGDPSDAAPLAAAIEILHNFTLVHDDIQDQSPTRRHRDTVWTIWGRSQAINAGDALFAAAHLALLRLREIGVPPATVLDLIESFERMTIEIVSGQTLDLTFEERLDVTPAEYLAMIGGKTAAIVRFAAAAGARIGAADPVRSAQFGEFGFALGIGFQIQDDLLGVWGAAQTTGKAVADDIRRRKKSLPILMLRQRANDSEIAELDQIYATPEIGPDGVVRVLRLLDRHAVRGAVEGQVHAAHDRAKEALLMAAPDATGARALLLDRVEMLSTRSG